MIQKKCKNKLASFKHISCGKNVFLLINLNHGNGCFDFGTFFRIWHPAIISRPVILVLNEAGFFFVDPFRPFVFLTFGIYAIQRHLYG